MLSPHWTLRWLAMLILFATCTFAFSAYASATPGPDDGDALDQQPESDTDTDAGQTETGDDTESAAETDSGDDSRPEAAASPNQSPDYMVTITRSAYLGALLGALVGGSFYILTGRDYSPWVIGYSAAGGVFLGAMVGTLEVATRESRERQRLQTFDDQLHDERQRRTFSEPTLQLLEFNF